MDKLADSDRLPEFDDAHLTPARIRDRTYGHLRQGSKLIFKINRHPYAWKNEARMIEIVQTWEFDFVKLSLTKVE